MTIRPPASLTFDVTDAATVSPVRFVRDEICALVVAAIVVPAARLAAAVVRAVDDVRPVTRRTLSSLEGALVEPAMVSVRMEVVVVGVSGARAAAALVATESVVE